MRPTHIVYTKIFPNDCRRITERELGQVDESLPVAVGSPVRERLRHQKGVVEAVAFKRLLHQFDRLQRSVGVEVTIRADYLCAFQVQSNQSVMISSGLINQNYKVHFKVLTAVGSPEPAVWLDG